MGEMKTPACHACGVEMKLKKRTILHVSNAENMLSTFVADYEMLYTDIYVCPQCRRMELFEAMTPAEDFEQIPKEGVERFEYNFKDYTDKQLQKVIEGKDYVDEAKRAAKRLLARRRDYEQ